MAITSSDVTSGPSPTNGAATTFSFNFRLAAYGDVSAADQIKVILVTTATGAETVLTEGVNAGQFSLSLNGDQDSAPGGSIETVTTYPSGYSIYIRLKPSFTQQTELSNQGPLNAQTIEDQFDQTTRQILDLNDRLRRSPVLGVQAGENFDGEISGTLTAGYAPIVKPDLSGFQLGAPASVAVSSAMTPAVQAATTNEGLAALNGVLEVATKAALSALTGGVVSAVIVRGRSAAGDGYEGVFHWRSGNQSANVTADPAGALWVAPDAASTGSSGAWQRMYNGPIEVRWFAPTADGTTDDLTPLTRFLNSVMASTHRRGTLDNKIYAISGALPNINVNGVDIRGVGPSSNHDVGSASSAHIKAITNTGFTMLTVAPTSGAGNQRLDGINLSGITFNANSQAAKGLVVQSIMRSNIDVTVLEATNTGMELGVVATLGEARDIQRNTFRYVGRQYSNAVASLRLTGDSTANTSFNVFELVDVNHYNAVAIISENADNNVWRDVRVYRAAGGSATNSIEWRGGSTSAVSTRGEFFYQLSTTVAAIAKGTGTYTVGAQNIIIDHLDTDNGTPTPTEETGASIVHKAWRTYTPTVGSFSGTITSASATGRYRRLGRKVEVSVVVTITTNGTGGTELTATLPITAGANNIAGYAGRENLLTGMFVSGYTGNGGTTIRMRQADGTYPGADGYVITMSGSYET